MARKTFAVADLVSNANTMLANSTTSPDTRTGMISLLESVLHKAGKYNGFSYLSASQVPKGQKPGIVWEGNVSIYPDPTRRMYY